MIRRTMPPHSSYEVVYNYNSAALAFPIACIRCAYLHSGGETGHFQRLRKRLVPSKVRG